MAADDSNAAVPVPAPVRPTFAARAVAIAKRFGPAGPLAAAVIVLPVLGGAVLLGTLKELGPWCRANALGVGPIVVTVGGTLLAGTSLLPTYAITMLAGWSFGFLVGVPVAFIAHTAAGLVGFGLARLLVGDRVPQSLEADPRLNAVRRALVGQGYVRAGVIIALIRLAPVAPFGVTNVLAASARCPFLAFAVGSALGILPQTILVVFVASRMHRLSFEQQPWMIAVGVVSTLIVITILTTIARDALSRVTAERK